MVHLHCNRCVGEQLLEVLGFWDHLHKYKDLAGVTGFQPHFVSTEEPFVTRRFMWDCCLKRQPHRGQLTLQIVAFCPPTLDSRISAAFEYLSEIIL